MDFKPFIEFIKSSNVSREEALKLLKEEKSLTPEEKNIIFLYCFPRPLADGELTKRIQKYRENNNITKLSLSPDLNETGLIIEAAKTEQYSRFIKHLMYSFGNLSKVATVTYDYSKDTESENKTKKSDVFDYPVPDTKTEVCALCGRKLLYYNDWKAIIDQQLNGLYGEELLDELHREEFLAFGSNESDIILCKHCLIQLANAYQIMDDIEPSFLDWTKRVTNNVSSSWDKLKIN